MRRGLLSWSEQEVPRSVLDGRVARCREAMATAGLDALLVYTNFPRPSAVSYLTHFVPYWSQGVLAVFADRPPVFAVSLSKRVAGWIEETAHVSEIMSTPNIGRDLGALLAETVPGGKVGVLELGKLPGLIVSNLRQSHPDIVLNDASALFAGIRNPADETEIALSRRAAAIAHSALALARPGDDLVDASILSDVERAARLQGCEEILIDIAEDLSKDDKFRRLDGPSNFANRYAVRVSLAYKGHWVRVGRTFEQDGSGERAALVETYLREHLPSLCATPLASFEAIDQVIEACTGSAPLTVIPKAIPGAIISLTQRWRDDHGYWLASEPLLSGNGAADPAASLVDE